MVEYFSRMYEELYIQYIVNFKKELNKDSNISGKQTRLRKVRKRRKISTMHRVPSGSTYLKYVISVCVCGRHCLVPIFSKFWEHSKNPWILRSP